MKKDSDNKYRAEVIHDYSKSSKPSSTYSITSNSSAQITITEPSSINSKFDTISCYKKGDTYFHRIMETIWTVGVKETFLINKVEKLGERVKITTSRKKHRNNKIFF